MKKKTECQSTTLHNNVIPFSIYEMEIWNSFKHVELCEDLLRNDLEDYGRIPCYISSGGVGYYLTKESALKDYKTILDNESDSEEVLCMQICEKPHSCILDKGSYTREWSYDNKGVLLDESLARNYNEDNSRFKGRPDEMICHKIGDIVQVIEDGHWYWGVVVGLPPNPKQAKHINQTFAQEAGITAEGVSWFDSADDSYTIITDNKEIAGKHIVAHNVFKPLTDIPAFVRKTLTDAFDKVKKNKGNDILVKF